MRNTKAGNRPMVIVLYVIALLVTGVALAACSSDDTNQGGKEVKGGEVTISQGKQPDFLDPALSYTYGGWEPMSVVYTPLVTFQHAEGQAGSKLIPGLAEALPTVSADGKTYTMKLRKGLKYSDGTEVKASDFEHAIKRLFTLNSGATSNYDDIQGASAYIKAKDPNGDISGITTDDKTGAIKITLNEPDAQFQYLLGMMWAAPVPGNAPYKNMTKDPLPGVGPYKLTDSVPNRSFVLEKVPGFAALGIPGIPVGHLDKITTKITENVNTATQDVLDNKLDYMLDTPPTDLRPTVKSQAGDRYRENPNPSTFYFFLNSRVPPMDDPLVRQAINYGVDKPALARLFGGLLAPGCSWIPPGIAGYDKAFDTTDCPYGDPSQPPDVAKAKDLIKQAGADGTKVTVWGSDEDPSAKVTEAVADMLTGIGLDAKPKIVGAATYYQTVQNAKTKAQMGYNNWNTTLHPLDAYFPVNGATIQPTLNENPGNVDDPHINSEIQRLKRVSDLDSVAADWSALDSYLVGPPHAYVMPYGHLKRPTFLSNRLDFQKAIFEPTFKNDYTSWQLKQGDQ